MSVVLFPNDSVNIQADATFNDHVVALEPRRDSVTFRTSKWPSHHLTTVCEGTIRLINNTTSPIRISKNDHLCQIRGTSVVDVSNIVKTAPRPKKKLMKASPPYCKQVIIDPNNQLSADWKIAFEELNRSYDTVFEDKIGRYNDKSGKVRARINISNSTQNLQLESYVCPTTARITSTHYKKSLTN